MALLRYLHIISIVAFLSVFLMTGCSRQLSFMGTELNPIKTAPAFQLQNQFGNMVSLSELSGKVVVLTFLYTSCPDTCPVITQTLRQTYLQLDKQVNDVAFVAISIDPKRDLSEEAYSYSKRHNMLNKWNFLVGRPDELNPIWGSYYISTSLQEGTPSTTKRNSAKNFRDQGLDELIAHSYPIYLIDRNGHLRVLFTNPPIDPSPLLHDIKLLL